MLSRKQDFKKSRSDRVCFAALTIYLAALWIAEEDKVQPNFRKKKEWRSKPFELTLWTKVCNTGLILITYSNIDTAQYLSFFRIFLYTAKEVLFSYNFIFLFSYTVLKAIIFLNFVHSF